MSVPSRKIVCTGCSFEGWMKYRPMLLVYELDNEITFEVGRNYGWCHSCDSVRDIEPYFDISELSQNIRNLENELVLIRKSFFGFLNKSDKQNEIKADILLLKQKLNLSTNRSSSQRCIACGSEHVESLSFVDDQISNQFTHKCGGNLLLTAEDDNAPRFFFKLEKVHLDKEGVRKNLDLYTINNVSKSIDNSDLVLELYQWVIDGQYELHDIFLQELKYDRDDLDIDEITFFALTVLAYTFLRFSKRLAKEVTLDEFIKVILNDIDQSYIESNLRELITRYQIVYKEYFVLINSLFNPDFQDKPNPSITLALHFFERVTNEGAKNNMTKVVFLSKILSDYVVKQVEFAKI